MCGKASDNVLSEIVKFNLAATMGPEYLFSKMQWNFVKQWGWRTLPDSSQILRSSIWS